LAVCLLEARGFSSEDFARYHPGGSLGKQLYLTVEDLAVKDAVPMVKEDADLTEVILEISGKRLGATAVVNGEGKLVGIVTDGDLRRMLERRQDLSKVTAKDIMTIGPKTMDRKEYAVRALNRMREFNITQLVVMDKDEVFGFIHIHDLMKEGIV